MKQSTRHAELLHVGIIMDGNGRWAIRQGLPRAAGHREGAVAVRRVIEGAPALGVGTLTLFAFSSDNWQRPEREVQWLMRLFREYLRGEIGRCREAAVRLSVIGRRDRFPRGVADAIAEAERATAAGRRLHVRLAVDYSARDTILHAASVGVPGIVPTREEFVRRMAAHVPGASPVPDVDLLVRSGGEQRLSDFLLWECAYAELVFTPAMWPDFTAADLAAAVHQFHARERRFGALPPDAVPDTVPAAAGQLRRI
jgi:undecaprenyl diphosphate synthase